MLTTSPEAALPPAAAMIEQLGLRDATLAELARQCGGTMLGEDLPIHHLRLPGGGAASGVLTVAENGPQVRAFAEGPHEAAIVRPTDLGSADPAHRSLIVHRAPMESFLTLHAGLVARGAYGMLEGGRADDADISPTAVIHPGVHIGHGVRIAEHTVVHSNTVLGDGVVIGAGSIIGSDGVRSSILDGHRLQIPHAGGVILSGPLTVGSLNCISRGLFSNFTVIGTETTTGGLVHIGPDAAIGVRGAVGAGSIISEDVVLEDDVRMGPGSVCGPSTHLARGVLVETGAVVDGDVAPFTRMEGNPARPAGQVCLCGLPLTPGDEWVIRCPNCGRDYAAPDGVLTAL